MNKMALASICEAVLFGSLFASGVSAQQVSFLARRDFPVGSSPASVAVRDFNGDGVHSPWTATNTVGAPSGREAHTAVWTGSEMIVWGGFDRFGPFNTGGRYNPTTDSWIVTSTTDTPTARSDPATVWSGSEMIVWVGLSVTDLNLFNTGGRYNPTTDSWIATSTMDAPSPRFGPITVWTESEMIVWGGLELRDDPVPHTPTAINTGGRYDPATDSWLTTSMMDGPCPRFGPSAVWTESEMIVWGGSDTNTGGRYCPAADN